MAKTGTSVGFKYNANGLRVQKTVNGVATDYTLHGKLVTGLKQGVNNLHFFYGLRTVWPQFPPGVSGLRRLSACPHPSSARFARPSPASRPAMVDFNGTMYTYVHNLQGDIVAIVDSAGVLVVEYKYDAWGRPIPGYPVSKYDPDSSTLTTEYATLKDLNPFRYRGYVWDEDTGLYYLRSRYYNPTWGRFVNADSLLGKVGALLSHNMFTYCRGNTVIASDPDGHDPWWGLLSIAIAQLIIKTRGDVFGEKIMAHYFYGNGKKLTISKDVEWNRYLMDNYKFKRELDRCARAAISSGTYKISITGKQVSLSIDPNDHEEGGYSTGYQLINGSNVDFGGLCISGNVTQLSDKKYRVNAHYEFHDYMDTGSYTTDVAAVVTSWAMVGGCFFYELEINGDVSYDLTY